MSWELWKLGDGHMGFHYNIKSLLDELEVFHNKNTTEIKDNTYIVYPQQHLETTSKNRTYCHFSKKKKFTPNGKNKDYE